MSSSRLALPSLFTTLLLTCSLSAASAGAAPQPLTTVSSDSALSAAGGWVAWSEQSEGGWQLVAWHEGQKQTLPVAARSVPFDVDLGTDAAGNTVATYSRCSSEPKSRDGNGIPDWSRAKGCRLYQLDLASGAEQRLRVPGKGSDSTPSRSGTRLAFARASSGLTKLYLYSGGKSLKQLPGGVLRGACPYTTGCKKGSVRSAVQQLDLSGTQAAYLWRVQGPGVSGTGAGWQIYTVNAKGKRRLLGNGLLSGTCGPNFITSPAVVAGQAWYSNMEFCDWKTEELAAKPAFLLRGSLGAKKVSQAQLDGAVWKTAADEQGGLYAIHGSWPLQSDTPCADGSCQLTYDPAPPAASESFTPGGIFW